MGFFKYAHIFKYTYMSSCMCKCICMTAQSLTQLELPCRKKHTHFIRSKFIWSTFETQSYFLDLFLHIQNQMSIFTSFSSIRNVPNNICKFCAPGTQSAPQKSLSLKEPVQYVLYLVWNRNGLHSSITEPKNHRALQIVKDLKR